MYKEFTDKIVAYKLSNKDNALKVQTILKNYLIEYDVWKEGRDMSVEGFIFAKNSAFYNVFVRNGLLGELYEPIYETISLSKEFMFELGFKTIKDDGIVGHAESINNTTNVLISWIRKNNTIDITIMIDVRIVFDGHIFNEDELKFILKRI